MARFSSRIFVATFAVATLLHAQDASAPAAKQVYNKVIGAVESVASDGKSLVVKPDSGASATVLLDENTSYMQVPPGEKDLRKATRIDLKDVAPGDRVYARSRKVEGDSTPTPAVSVIVMSKTEVAQHQEKSAAEWQRRGAAGRIKAIDPTAKTVTVSVQGRGGSHDLIVEIDAKTTFRRYAPDSVKFADAKPSDFATLAVGNNVRVLGDKNEEGTSIHAEELVSGSFRNLAGTVISVDSANNQIKVNDLQTKKPVTVTVNADTNLRKIPQQMAMMIAARTRAASAGAAGTPGAGSGGAPGANQSQSKAQGGPDSKPGFNGPGATAAGGPPGGTGAGWSGKPGGGAGGGAAGGMDLNRALEQAPPMALTDLKPGDALMISSSSGADASRVTAIAVIGGVEPILAAAPSSSAQSALSGRDDARNGHAAVACCSGFKISTDWIRMNRTTMFGRYRSTYFALALCALLAIPLAAQNAGTVTGQITDETGSSIPAASVSVLKAGAIVRTVQTNEQGVFTAPNIPAGNYTVRIGHFGFSTVELKVPVGPGQRATVNSQLKLAAESPVCHGAGGLGRNRQRRRFAERQRAGLEASGNRRFTR